MQEHDRPVRTIKALAKLFPGATRIRVGEVEVRLSPEPAQYITPTVSPPAPGTGRSDKEPPEPSISDADLVLDVPAGMLVPVSTGDSN